MLAMSSTGRTHAASAGGGAAAAAVAWASQRVGDVTYTLHGTEIASPDDADLFALALPAPFGRPLLRAPVFWSWDAPGAPAEADVGAMLEHLASVQRVQDNPIILRDVLSIAPPTVEATREEEEDHLSEESLSDSASGDEPLTDLSDAEEDVISLLESAPTLDE